MFKSCLLIWAVKQFKAGSQHSLKMICFDALQYYQEDCKN